MIPVKCGMEMKVGEELGSKFLLTHTLTHTGKRADGNNGAKSAADLILLSKQGRKVLKIKGRKAPDQLVRMRSAVRIRPAAP